MSENNGEIDKLKLKEILNFQVKREMTHLSKNFLNILENLLEEGYYFDYNKYRKSVLDELGSRNRELENFMDRFEIKLK